MEQLLFNIKKFEKDTSQISDFIQSNWMVGDMRVMALEFLEKMRALKLSSMPFKLTARDRAEFEVMLKFMNEFQVQSPDFWLLE